MILQNFIKLSAAVHNYHANKEKSSNENNTIRRYCADSKNTDQHKLLPLLDSNVDSISDASYLQWMLLRHLSQSGTAHHLAQRTLTYLNSLPMISVYVHTNDCLTELWIC